MNKKIKICFVALHIYPYFFSDNPLKTSGGAELQQFFIGKGLTEAGYKVSYLSLDFGQECKKIIDGITIIKTYKQDAGIAGLRFFYPRLWRIWQALKSANADIYYVRCAGYLAGIIAFFCKIYDKKFIFSVANEPDVSPDKLKLPNLRDKILYFYGLRRANTILVQTEDQKQLLWKNFKRKGKLIRNFHPFKSKPTETDKEFILWVSTIRKIKKPFDFIKLCKHFPNEKFIMIGGRPNACNNYTNKLYDSLVEQARYLPNLHFLGFQPFETTEHYFNKAKVLINTSDHEGFPNTFLQAWRRGIPVISYVDPDGVIDRYKLGYQVNSDNELICSLSKIISNNLFCAEKIIQYYDQHHSSAVLDQYSQIIDGIK